MPEKNPNDVTQVTLSPASANVPAAGGPGSFRVALADPETSAGTWIVTKDAAAPWLTFTPTAAQSAGGAVNYTAAANTGAARVAHLTINGKTFTLNQAAGA